MHLPAQLREGGAILSRVLSEELSNGLACIYGTIEAADGEQEGFLNLSWVCFIREVESVQECVKEWGRLTKLEFVPSLNDDVLNIWLPLDNHTFTNGLDSDISSSLRKLKDFNSNSNG